MIFTPIDPPRKYEAGFEYKRIISDCGRISLEADEQVTFTTKDGAEYDLARKSWGFYASPSTNKRLSSFGLRTVLTLNRLGQCFVLLVEKGHEAGFEEYMQQEKMSVLCWLDNDEAIKNLEKALASRP